LIAGSFMDYAIAHADDLPDLVTECDKSQPCTHNPLGAKGCGEAGSIGAPAALVGAALGPRAGHTSLGNSGDILPFRRCRKASTISVDARHGRRPKQGSPSL
jgi:hypothetical protein